MVDSNEANKSPKFKQIWRNPEQVTDEFSGYRKYIALGGKIAKN